MLKVISLKICPFVQRVTAMLEAKSIPYEVEFVDFSAVPQWFLDSSPNAQVPLLVTESGAVLFESEAIVEYIDETTAPLEPDVSAEQRAFDRAWSYQASKHYLVQCGAMASADKKSLTKETDKLGIAFEKVEKQLGAGRYFKGDALSNVDIAWLPLLHRAEIIERHSGYDFVNDYPRVKLWQLALMKTGLAEKSVPEDFEKTFTDYYLSDTTFLGTGRDCTSLVDECCESTCCG